MTTKQGLRDALANVVAAWESLPGGCHYSPREVETWLRTQMTPAVNGARAALTETAPSIDEGRRRRIRG